MIKSLLVFFGLRKAPTPVRKYLAASSVFGAVPTAAYFAWKYRDSIKAGVRRFAPATRFSMGSRDVAQPAE